MRKTDGEILERIAKLKEIILYSNYGHKMIQRCKIELDTLEYVMGIHDPRVI